MDAGELVPAAGPHRLDRAAGAVLVGARAPLVALNVDLDTNDVAVAREVAAAVRESGGGLAGVQALGLELPRGGRVQVSMNVVDLASARLHDVVVRVTQEAAARGVRPARAELVGLVPAGALGAAVADALLLDQLDASHVVEAAALDALS